MGPKSYTAVLIPVLIFFFNLNRTPFVETYAPGVTSPGDSAHYWTLKPHLDPHVESVRINPANYEDNGMIEPPGQNDRCSTGYDELCGIYVIPDPANKKQPAFSKTRNSDIYEALRKNIFLEGKVFYKDL
jgi:hypothetical protein